MPSVQYLNQTAPFWDFVASLEDQGSDHPFFNRANQQGQDSDHEQQPPQSNPWAEGFAGFPFGGPFAHRGRHNGPGRHHLHGPPPPPPVDHEMPDPPEKAPGEDDGEQGPSEPRGPPPPFSEEPPHHGPGRHEHHGPRPHEHHGPRPHEHHGPGPRGRCGGRGRFGGRGGHRGGPWNHPAFAAAAAGGPMGGLGALAEMFQSQLFGNNNEGEEKKDAAPTTEKDETFTPEADVFDAAESFVIHVSLPGAKKEDVAVSWDAATSTLSIAGVVYRPGDEELLKTLALDERKVGVFERKVRLGSRANPAQVDVDAISAKLEDGILRVDVPKLDAGYVEVKKVDVE